MTELGAEERDPSQETFTAPIEADRRNWDAIVGSAVSWISEVRAQVTELPAAVPEIQEQRTNLIEFLDEQVGAKSPETVFLLDVLESAAVQSEARSRRPDDASATARQQARQARELQLGNLGTVMEAYKKRA
jgi:hypothetical protein